MIETITRFIAQLAHLFRSLAMAYKTKVRVNRKLDPQQLLANLEMNLTLMKRLPEFRSPEVHKILADCLEFAREILSWAPQYDVVYQG